MAHKDNLAGRLSRLFVVVLATAIVVGLVALPFETVRGHLDRMAGDGSADPYSPQLHRRLRWVGVACVLSVIGVCLSAEYFRRRFGFVSLRSVWVSIRERGNQTRRYVRALCKGNGFWLAGLTAFGLVLRLPHLDLPVRHDEAYTYLFFSKFPWYVGLSYYDDPNNHLLHTALVHLSTELFGNSIVSIRIPALVAGVLLIPATFLAARSIGGRTAAIYAGTLVSASSALIEYSANGRGYTMVCLFTSLGWLFASRVVRTNGTSNSRGRGWWGLVGVSTFGLWTIPIMLYPCSMIWIWLLVCVISRSEKGQLAARIKNWVFHVGVMAACTCVVYAPVLIVSGLGKLIGNPYVKPLQVSEFLNEVPASVAMTHELLSRDWVLPLELFIAVGFLLAIAAGYRAHSRIKYAGLALATSLAVCLAVVAMQRVLPPARVWLFVLPTIAIFSGVGWSYITDRLSRRQQSATIVVCLILLGVAPAIDQWMSQSMRSSSEPDLAPEAELILDYIRSNHRESRDVPPPIVAVFPHSSPLVYLAEQEGLDPRHFDYPDEKTIDSAIIIVDRRSNQSVEQIFQELGITHLANPSDFQPIHHFKTATLHTKPRQSELNQR